MNANSAADNIFEEKNENKKAGGENLENKN